MGRRDAPAFGRCRALPAAGNRPATQIERHPERDLAVFRLPASAALRGRASPRYFGLSPIGFRNRARCRRAHELHTTTSRFISATRVGSRAYRNRRAPCAICRCSCVYSRRPSAGTDRARGVTGHERNPGSPASNARVRHPPARKRQKQPAARSCTPGQPSFPVGRPAAAPSGAAPCRPASARTATSDCGPAAATRADWRADSASPARSQRRHARSVRPPSPRRAVA